MTLNEAHESTKQSCTFLLKNSKVKRKGGLCELDISPIIATFTLDERV
jgi:hypothetical protein